MKIYLFWNLVCRLFIGFTIWKMKHLWTCFSISILWSLDGYFSNDFRLPTLTPQNFLFEISNGSSIAENVSLLNHVLLIFKVHLYKFCKNTFVESELYYHQYTYSYIWKIFEKKIAPVSDRKSKIYHKKWNVTINCQYKKWKNKDNIKCFLKKGRWELAYDVIVYLTLFSLGISPKLILWLLVLTLLPHWYKMSMPYLVPVANYWTWTKTTPQKNWFFWSNPIKLRLW